MLSSFTNKRIGNYKLTYYRLLAGIIQGLLPPRACRAEQGPQHRLHARAHSPQGLGCRTSGEHVPVVAFGRNIDRAAAVGRSDGRSDGRTNGRTVGCAVGSVTVWRTDLYGVRVLVVIQLPEHTRETRVIGVFRISNTCMHLAYLSLPLPPSRPTTRTNDTSCTSGSLSIPLSTLYIARTLSM